MEGSFCLQINKSLLCLQKSLTFSHASAWTLTRWVVNNQRKRLLVISLFQVTHSLAALKRADHASKHTQTHTLTGKTTNVLTRQMLDHCGASLSKQQTAGSWHTDHTRWATVFVNQSSYMCMGYGSNLNHELNLCREWASFMHDTLVPSTTMSDCWKPPFTVCHGILSSGSMQDREANKQASISIAFVHGRNTIVWQLWGVICVKFHRHSVQAQLATMQAQSANMRAQHEGTTWGHNMRAQHESTTWGHNMRTQH